MSLVLRPILVAPAKAHVLRTHRRLPRVAGGMWSVGVYEGAELAGVCVVGRPVARVWQRIGWLQVLRVAVVEGCRNACSMLYGAASRAAKAMGAVNLWTYVFADESGVSLKAAGWRQLGTTRAEQWDREERHRAQVEMSPKVRWFAPWSEALSSHGGWPHSSVGRVGAR